MTVWSPNVWLGSYNRRSVEQDFCGVTHLVKMEPNFRNGVANAYNFQRSFFRSQCIGCGGGLDSIKCDGHLKNNNYRHAMIKATAYKIDVNRFGITCDYVHTLRCETSPASCVTATCWSCLGRVQQNTYTHTFQLITCPTSETDCCIDAVKRQLKGIVKSHRKSLGNELELVSKIKIKKSSSRSVTKKVSSASLLRRLSQAREKSSSTSSSTSRAIVDTTAVNIKIVSRGDEDTAGPSHWIANQGKYRSRNFKCLVRQKIVTL